MPDDSLIPGKKVQEIPLNGSVVSSVNGSPPNWIKSRTFHSPDTIATENSGTHGRSMWVHSSQGGRAANSVSTGAY